MIQQRNPYLNFDETSIPLFNVRKQSLLILRSSFMRRCLTFFSVLLHVTSCCCRNYLFADDETSNVFKLPVRKCSLTFWSQVKIMALQYNAILRMDSVYLDLINNSDKILLYYIWDFGTMGLCARHLVKTYF